MSDFLTNIAQNGLGVKPIIRPRLPGWFEPWITGNEPLVVPGLESTTDVEAHDDPALTLPASAALPPVEAPTPSAFQAVMSDAGDRQPDVSPSGLEPLTASQKKQGDADPVGSVDLERLAARPSSPTVSPHLTEPQTPPLAISPTAVQPAERPVEAGPESNPPVWPPLAVDEVSPAMVSPAQLSPGHRATPETADQSPQAARQQLMIQPEVSQPSTDSKHELIEELTRAFKPDQPVGSQTRGPTEIRTVVEARPLKQENDFTQEAFELSDRLVRLERTMSHSPGLSAPPEMPGGGVPMPLWPIEPLDQAQLEPASQVPPPDHPPLPEPPDLRPTAESRPAPTVQVTIGRVEVRAATAPAPKKRKAAAPVMSLDEYLRQRDQGGGR